jgi:hypothetical protein
MPIDTNSVEYMLHYMVIAQRWKIYIALDGRQVRTTLNDVLMLLISYNMLFTGYPSYSAKGKLKMLELLLLMLTSAT